MDIPTKTELFEKMIEEAVAFHNGNITESTMRQEGTDVNSLLMAGVALGDEICYQIYQAIKNSNPQTAEDEDLDKLLFDWFGLTRLAASSAQVELTFARTGITSGSLPAGMIVSTNNNVAFAIDDNLNFTSVDLSGSIIATAVLAGTDGNVAASSIYIMTQPTWDNTFTVTNINRASGGRAQETDAQFRRRAAEYWTSQQKGTSDAIIFGAKQVAGVTDVYLSESSIASDQNARFVQLVVTDSSGGSNDLFVSNVQNEIENWRACGVWVEVLGGEAVNVTINLTYDYKAGYNETTVDAAVKKALINYVNSRKLNESVYPDVMKSIVEKVSGVFGNVVIITPSATIIPTYYQILKTDETLIVINA